MGAAAIVTMEFFTRVLVLTSSSLLALYTTSKIRVLRVCASDPQAKLPVSSLRALYFLFPPRVRMVWIRRAPNLVLAAGRPSSYFLFFLSGGMRPPVFLLLCHLSPH